MKRLILILLPLFISVGFSQQKWDKKFMTEYNGLIYSPNSDKPYTAIVFVLNDNGQKIHEKSYKNGNKEYQGWYRDEKKSGLWREKTDVLLSKTHLSDLNLQEDIKHISANKHIYFRYGILI